MSRLAYPLAGDPSIVSGESGAAGFALVWQLLSDPEQAHLKERLQLNQDSRVLCINSEGDTDPISYLKGIEKYKGSLFMIEIPEAVSICRQMQETLVSKTIVQAKANFSPHKFAWYIGDPEAYGEKLEGKTFQGCKAQSGMIELWFDEMRIVLGMGSSSFYTKEEKKPAKHQLQLEFADGSGLYSVLLCMVGFGPFRRRLRQSLLPESL